jgi:hypothetical protein
MFQGFAGDIEALQVKRKLVANGLYQANPKIVD